MKRLLYILIPAAMALLLAYSCDKENQPEIVEEVVMEPAETSSDAQMISFESTLTPKPTLIVDGETCEIISIELTESSRFIIRYQPAPVASSLVPTKANAERPPLSGTFDVILGGGYELHVDKKVTVCASTGAPINKLTIDVDTNAAVPTVTISDDAGTAQVATAVVEHTASAVVEVEKVNANRAWSVTSTFITVSGKGINIEKGFKGCSFYEMAAFIQNTGVNYDASKLSGYAIEEILFTGSSTMLIKFASANDFYGTYTLNGEKISYKLTVGSNDLMSASADGTLIFPKDKEAILTLNTSLKGYKGSIEFTMKEKK